MAVELDVTLEGVFQSLATTVGFQIENKINGIFQKQNLSFRVCLGFFFVLFCFVFGLLLLFCFGVFCLFCFVLFLFFISTFYLLKRHLLCCTRSSLRRPAPLKRRYVSQAQRAKKSR